MSEPLTPEQVKYQQLEEHCAVVEHCLKNVREEAEALHAHLAALEAAGERLAEALEAAGGADSYPDGVQPAFVAAALAAWRQAKGEPS